MDPVPWWPQLKSNALRSITRPGTPGSRATTTVAHRQRPTCRTREQRSAAAFELHLTERERHVIPTIDIEWMVIKESLGVEEAARWRRARVEEMLGMTSNPEAP